MPFHVDSPVTWKLQNRFVAISGWCFGEERDEPQEAGRAVTGQAYSVKGIRLALPGFVVNGAVGLPRPDVKVSLPNAPDEFTGFEISALLPRGKSRLEIQARDSVGAWTTLLRTETTTPWWQRPYWLGGGRLAELMAFQTPTQAVHPPQPLRQEKYPPLRLPTERMPGFSIVIPSLGQAGFLDACISSLVCDDGIDADYVVQDGGSTDGSIDIIRRHTARLHAWESAPDQGQADAVARGFAKTTGGPEDLMAWINADDFYLPGALAFVADYFAMHPEVDVLYGNRVLVDEKGGEIGRWFLPRHNPAVLRLNDFVPQETMFWRRRIWDKVGGVDTSLQFAIDWDLLLRFQTAGARMAHVPYFLACFRVHPAQKTAAQMQNIGQREIDQLRERTFGRRIASAEIEAHPILLSYLRRSAFIEFLWKFGIRA